MKLGLSRVHSQLSGQFDFILKVNRELKLKRRKIKKTLSWYKSHCCTQISTGGRRHLHQHASLEPPPGITSVRSNLVGTQVSELTKAENLKEQKPICCLTIPSHQIICEDRWIKGWHTPVAVLDIFFPGGKLAVSMSHILLYMTRNQINDTFLFQNRVKVKVVGEVSEKWN